MNQNQDLTNGQHAVKPNAVQPVHPRLGVPELAGVCTYEEAARSGLGVEENVALLKRSDRKSRQ